MRLAIYVWVRAVVFVLVLAVGRVVILQQPIDRRFVIWLGVIIASFVVIVILLPALVRRFGADDPKD